MGKAAGFWVRLIAELIDLFLWALIFTIIMFFVADAQTLSQLTWGIFTYLIILGFPLAIIIFFYKPAFTHYFGGNIGKLLTGLIVTNLSNKLLSFKTALFRYTVGYAFSGVLFGVGFLSIITDSEKRAFHDKVVGSKVTVTRNIWPLGLVVLIALLLTHFIFWGNTLQKLNRGPLKSEFGFLLLNFSEEIKNSASPIPSSTPGSTILPKFQQS